MPPVFSLRVMRPLGAIVLVGYGVTSLFIAGLARRSARHQLDAAVSDDPPGYHSTNRAIAPAREAREVIQIIAAPDGLHQPPRILHPDGQIERVMGDVMKIAFERMPAVYKVSLVAGLQPGRKPGS